MAKRSLFKHSFIMMICMFFATTLFAQDPQDISGTLVDPDGNNVVQTTILLLGEDGTEAVSYTHLTLPTILLV